MEYNLLKYIGDPRIVLTQPDLLKQFERPYVQVHPKVHVKTLQLVLNHPEIEDTLTEMIATYDELVRDFIDVCDLKAVEQFKSVAKHFDMEAIQKAASRVCARILTGDLKSLEGTPYLTQKPTAEKPIGDMAVTFELRVHVSYEKGEPFMKINLWFANGYFNYETDRVEYSKDQWIDLDGTFTVDNAEQTVDILLKEGPKK
jgi:hypothetical protein